MNDARKPQLPIYVRVAWATLIGFCMGPLLAWYLGVPRVFIAVAVVSWIVLVGAVLIHNLRATGQDSDDQRSSS